MPVSSSSGCGAAAGSAAACGVRGRGRGGRRLRARALGGGSWRLVADERMCPVLTAKVAHASGLRWALTVAHNTM